MELPQKCIECPVLQQALDAAIGTDDEFDELWEEMRGDDFQEQVDIQYHASRAMNTRYSGQTREQISDDMVKDMIVEMESVRAEKNELETQMQEYMESCDGPVRMIGCLRNGNLIQSIVCGSEAVEQSIDAEPTVVVRTQQ